jgi:hypothetical protein
MGGVTLPYTQHPPLHQMMMPQADTCLTQRQIRMPPAMVPRILMSQGSPTRLRPQSHCIGHRLAA